jgi:hypothetical protein
MSYSAEFIESLRSDPVSGALKICSGVIYRAEQTGEWDTETYDSMLEAYALLNSMIEGKLLDISVIPCVISAKVDSDCSEILRYVSDISETCNEMSTRSRLASLQTHFAAALGTGFSYEFSQGDLDRIHQLIAELRKLISESSEFEQPHQRRLLIRLERLQSEMHKRVSDLDKFWGLVGDAGVALGKFGNNAKPFVSLVKEITDIVWRTQARAEELPSNSPLPRLDGPSPKDE